MKWLLVVLAFLLALAGGAYWSGTPSAKNKAAPRQKSSPTPPAATLEKSALRKRLLPGPAAFEWTECLDGEPIEHHGGVVFYLAGKKVHSLAWFGRAKYARPWPPVTGAGILAGETLHIAYRSASNDPQHAFYHAECRFTFRSDGRAFECEFTQQASPDPEQALAPGGAAGKWVSDPDQEFQTYIGWVQRLPGQANREAAALSPDAPRCAVLTQMKADPALQARYHGRTYRFCCASCRAVFLNQPAAFAGDSGKP